ncbi:MAG TPA: methyltransferase domain-containing protein [Acidimicrobiales bacterium]|nr:methyltransferase domain-containing protein [Acidimicrobiales bacterium]
MLSKGYAEQGSTEYGFARMPNGLVLDTFMRRLFRAALMRAEGTGKALPPNPLVPGECDAFVSWLATPPEDSPRRNLSRYLLSLHSGRADLKEAFPDPEGANFESFAAWVGHEAAAGRIPVALAGIGAPPAAHRLQYEAGRQVGRVRRRLAAVPVPGTEHEVVRLNLAGAVRGLDKAVEAMPLPGEARRVKLNAHRALGRLERRLMAVPVPGTGDERVRINMARALGRLESRLLAAPLAPAPEPSAPSAAEPSKPGIRVAGYFTTESGVGELGRLTIATVREADLPLSTYLESSSVSRQAHPFDGRADDYDVNLICVNADELPNFARRVGRTFFDDHYTIGLWAWELEQFPEAFSAAFDHVDEVWGISSFVRDAIAATTNKPVFAFPLPILDPLPGVGTSSAGLPPSKASFDLPDSFTFLYCFDLLSIFERKNPLGLVEAFKRAFTRDEGPILAIKVLNSDLEPASMRRLLDAVAGREDIKVIDGYLDHDLNRALMQAADCYVSLHRSEGFGLTMAEAMAMGKPVIATGYSGNLDFMDDETSYLVSWRPGFVPFGCQPYPAGARWAEPDLDHAASLMRRVYDRPAEAEAIGARARESVLSKYGVGVRAAFVAERYQEARATLTDRRRPRSAAMAPRAVGEGGSGPQVSGELVQRVTRPRSLEAPSRHPRSAFIYRRVVARALRSHADHDREVHGDLARALEALQSRFEGDVGQIQQLIGLLRQDIDKAAAGLEDFDRRLRETTDAFEGASAEQMRLSHWLERLSGEVEGHQVELSSHGAEISTHQVDLAGHRAEIDALSAGADTLWRIAGAKGEFLSKAVELTRELYSLPYMADPGVFEIEGPDGGSVLGYGAERLSKDGYASFEDIFRGPESFIRDRLRPYLQYLVQNPPVVDLGCGRGEMLELLHEAGVDALGIDSDPTMVARARDKGYDVREEDIFVYLSDASNESVGAVFSAQVVEHLDAALVVRMLESSLRVLRPGGLLVIETVNPYPIQSFKAFWTDPTHRTMLYPEVLLQLCSSVGYSEAFVVFPNGSGDLSQDRWSQGEYAVVARKMLSDDEHAP